MRVRLNYVVVYCSGMKGSVTFYRDHLGFPVKFESPEWSELHSGATTLALHIANPLAEKKLFCGEAAPGQVQLGLEVLDIEKFYREKKEKGIRSPPPQSFGRKVAILQDPDGIAISVTEEIR